MPVKIIDLTTESAPTSDDYIIIRDNATGTTRKITLAQLFTNPPISASSIITAMIADGAITKVKLAPDATPTIRSNIQASPATLTHDVSSYEMEIVTALAGNMTIANPTGSPVEGQAVLFRIRDNGTARTISYGTQWRAIGVTAPTTTVAGKLLYMSARWNAVDLKWDIISVGRE